MLGSRLAATSCPVFGYCPPKDLSKVPAQPRLVRRAVPRTCLAWSPVSSRWAVLHLLALARQCHDGFLTDSSLQLAGSIPCAPHTGEAAESSASTAPKRWAAGERRGAFPETARHGLGGGLAPRTRGLTGRGSLTGAVAERHHPPQLDRSALTHRVPPPRPALASRGRGLGSCTARPCCSPPLPTVGS